MNYLQEYILDQRVHDAVNGKTNVPAIVVHVIEVDGVQWGCAYPLSRKILKRDIARVVPVELYGERVEFTSHTDKVYIPVYLEGARWMSVRQEGPGFWMREGGTDEWYLEQLRVLGIAESEVLYPKRAAAPEPHVNPLPKSTYKPLNVFNVPPRHNVDTVLLQLSDGVDEQGRPSFETKDGFDYALETIKKSFPSAAIVTGRNQLGQQYIHAIEAPHVTKQKRKTRHSRTAAP